MSLRPITIAGGGLAGLSLGILLREAGVPVTLYESGDYPRHRVCGEFMSGRGVRVLGRIGGEEGWIERGGRWAETALFATGRTCSGVRALPERALCLSRHTLDAELARIFAGRGGELRQGERWMEGFGREGVVRATGRRLAGPLREEGSRLLGLKAHAREVAMEADLEVHLIAEGYVGLCRLGDGVVNVCGLFRRNGPTPDVAERWKDYLRGPERSSLRRRMKGATFEDASFRAVAGLDLEARGWGRGIEDSGGEWSVGDSLTMIAPVAGNGMSMALESAAISAEVLATYSRGESGWEAARERAARRCEAVFGTRLRWARWLHEGLLSGRVADAVLRLAGWCPGGWKFLFGRTR